MTRLPQWSHGIPERYLRKIRKTVNPYSQPVSLEALEKSRYSDVYNSSPENMALVLSRYSAFEQCKRGQDETEAEHLNRLNDKCRKLGKHRTPPIHLGVSIQPLSDPVARKGWPSGRMIEFDLQTDKDYLLAVVSAMIDSERAREGIVAPTKRGTKSVAKKEFQRENSEFLNSIKIHRVVELWDIELAGIDAARTAVAKHLFPNSDAANGSKKLRRARELQSEGPNWIERLRASETRPWFDDEDKMTHEINEMRGKRLL